MPVTDYLPDVADVGALLRARTTAGMAGEQGTFTAHTRPTGDQVQAIIARAGGEVGASIGHDIPEAVWASARSLVALRAAMLVELSYFPEQVPGRLSPYESLREAYEAELPIVRRAAHEAGGGDKVGSVDDAKLPRYGGARGGRGVYADCAHLIAEGWAYARRVR